MGDRVTIQLIDDNENFSPFIYLHWAGERALEIIRLAAPVMRRGDLSYAFARLAGICHLQTGPDQQLSFGIWNAVDIQKGDMQGDNGHFQVNITTGEIKHFGGYSPEPGTEIAPLELTGL